MKWRLKEVRRWQATQVQSKDSKQSRRSPLFFRCYVPVATQRGFWNKRFLPVSRGAGGPAVLLGAAPQTVTKDRLSFLLLGPRMTAGGMSENLEQSWAQTFTPWGYSVGDAVTKDKNVLS